MFNSVLLRLVCVLCATLATAVNEDSEKLLSGLADSISHNTTFLNDDTSPTISRTLQISNNITGSINQFIRLSHNKITDTYKANRDVLIEEKADQIPVIITPVTFYSTITNFTTILVPNHETNNTISAKVFTNIVPQSTQSLSITESHKEINEHPNDDQTIVLNNTDSLVNGFPVIDTSFQTVSNVMPKTSKVSFKETKQLDFENLLKKAPVYTHSKVDKSINKKTQNITENKVTERTTIFGFNDFTTTINGVEVVFMPSSKTVTTNNIQNKQQTKVKLNAWQISTTKLNYETITKLKSTKKYISQYLMTTSTVKPVILPSLLNTISFFTPSITNDIKQGINPRFEKELHAESTEHLKQNDINRSTLVQTNDATSIASIIQSSLIEPSFTTSKIALLPTGLLSSITGMNEFDSIVTEWTTSVIGTYIKGTYAHILQSTSTIYSKLNTKTEQKLNIQPTKTSEFVALDSTLKPLELEEKLNLKQSLGYNNPVSQVFIESSMKIESGMTEPSYNEGSYLSTKSLKPSSITQLNSQNSVTITSGFILPADEGVVAENSLHSSTHPLGGNSQLPKQALDNQFTGSQSIQEILNTYYTTYTYFTTHFKGGSPLIDSRLETVTNIFTSSAEIKPITYYTRFTYLTTTVRNGKTTVNSNVITSSNVVHEAVTKTNIKPTKAATTYFTTYTYLTTFKKGETQFVKTRQEIVTNIMSNTDDINSNLLESTKTINEPIVTLYPTTSITTSESTSANVNSGMSTINSSRNFESHEENVLKHDFIDKLKSESITLTDNINEELSIKPKPDILADHSLLNLQSSQLHSSQSNEPNILSTSKPSLDGSLITSLNLEKLLSGLAVPITHYTTFTYYTTFFRDHTSDIISRTQVLSNVITGTINIGSTSMTDSNNEFNKLNDNKPKNLMTNTDKDFLTAEGAEQFPVIITPVTFYTTTTYFTTYAVPNHGTSVVSSAKVLTNVVIPGQNQVLPITMPFSTERHQASIIHSTIDERIALNKPLISETAFTTNSYYANRLINGYPVVDTSFETVANAITKTIALPLIESKHNNNGNINSETTYTYFTTRFINGTAIVTENKETITKLVSNALHSNSIEATKTRTPIVITRTRIAGSGFTPIANANGSRLRPIVIVRRRPDQTPKHISNKISGQFRSDNKSDAKQNQFQIRPKFNTNTDHPKSRGEPLNNRYAPAIPPAISPAILPTPVTFFTTYTYFTTELSNGRPVVRSREHIYSTVIQGKILPTRTIPSAPEFTRFKRSLLYHNIDYNDHIDLNNFKNRYNRVDSNVINPSEYTFGYNSTNTILHSDNKSKLSLPTGIISEKTEIKFINESPITIITELYGTFINGFYAQFAITKTKSSEIPTQTETINTSTNIEIPVQTFSIISQTGVSQVIESLSEQNQQNFKSEEISVNNTKSETIKRNNETSKIEITSTINDEITDSFNTISYLELELENSNYNSDHITPSVHIEELTVIDIEPSINETQSLSSSLTSLLPSSSYSFISKTGLISSVVETIENNVDNMITYIKSEIYGTYINGVYAHLAKTRTQILPYTPSSTSPESIFSTLITFITSADTNINVVPVVTGDSGVDGDGVITSSVYSNADQSAAMFSLQSSMIEDVVSMSDTMTKTTQSSVVDTNIMQTLNTIINDKKTTIYTTDILATNISGVMAHIAYVSSTILEQWTPLPGLASVSISNEVNDDLITAHTTEFYTTEINGFTAYYSRVTSNIIDSINKTESITDNTFSKTSSYKRIHFPTPVRAKVSSKTELINSTSVLTATITTTTTITTFTELINSDSISEYISVTPNLKDIHDYDSNDSNYTDEYYDESSEHSEEHTPRSRPIREKDSQPLEEYENDYVDNSDPIIEKPQNLVIPFRGYKSRQESSLISRNNGRQVSASPQYSAKSNIAGGFGQRVGTRSLNEENVNVNIQSSQRSRHSVPREVNVQEFNSQTLNTQRVIQRNRILSKLTPRYRQEMSKTSDISPTNSLESDKTTFTNRVSHENRHYTQYTNDRRPYNKHGYNPVTIRRKVSTTTTTTPPPTPRLLISNRRRIDRKNIVRSRNGNNHSNRELSNDHSVRNRNEYSARRGRTQQRGRTAKTTLLYLNKSSHTRSAPDYSSTKEITPEIPKIPLTVTSIITTVKTIPIFHGFKTSYATLTTTTLNTSVIETSQYETTVNPTDGITKTIFTRLTDSTDPLKLTEIIITTSILKEIKLIPIRIGFNTRTETLTDIRTFTELATIVTTAAPNPNAFIIQTPPQTGLSFTLFTTINSFINTQTLSSTTVLSILLRGKTLLNTITITSLTETTITTTQTLTIPIATQVQHINQFSDHSHPQPFTTLLTLSITGDGGDVTELITEVTVPVQPIFHTKVERDIKIATTSVIATNSMPLQMPLQMQQTLMPSYTTDNTIEFISASFKTVDQLQPIDSFFIKTIFKGPQTEIYEAKATVVHTQKPTMEKKKIYDYKYGTNFKKRKLQQIENDNLGYESMIMHQPIRLKDLKHKQTHLNLKPHLHNFQEESNDPIPDFVELDNPSRFQSLSQSSPARNAINGRQPTFQRIRINKLGTAQPFQSIQLLPTSLLPLSSPNEPTVRFQRIAGIQRRPESTSPIRIAPQSGFRRVPVFNNQIPSLQINMVRDTIRPTNVDKISSDQIELLSPTVASSNEERRQTFRRVRPVNAAQNGRRLKVSSRPVIPTPVSSTILESSTDNPFLPITDIDDVPRRRVISRKPVIDSDPNTPIVTQSDTTATAQLLTTTEQPRRVVRIRRPNASNNRKKVILRGKPTDSTTNELQPRGPVLAKDDELTRNNALDSDDSLSINPGYGTRIVDNISADKQLSSSRPIHTPVIPLTYYTTFTYLTTVLRGQHTATFSRESITSSVVTEALDKTIVDLIQSQEGYINPTSVIDLGTKTKGVTTTVINLKSRIQVFNLDLYKVIHSTKTKAVNEPTKELEDTATDTSTSITATKSSSFVDFEKSSVSSLNIQNLELIPRKHYTYFTYYYTLSDIHSTKYSTRAELVSSEPAVDLSLSTLKLDTTINSDGLLSIGSGPETVKLGSREFGGTTTEVNLALNTFIKFDGISNVVIEPLATTLYESTTKPASTLSSTNVLESTYLSGSFASSLTTEPFTTVSTPEIPLETELKLQSHTRKPVKLFSSAVIRDPNLRSKFETINGRPGVRVRVRPANDSKFNFARTSSLLEAIKSSSLTQSEVTSIWPTPTVLSSSESVKSDAEIIKETTKQVTPTKKRIAVTLRRPFSGNHRLSTLKPLNVQISSKPRFVVVTRTGSVGQSHVKSTASGYKISSRVYKSPVVSSDITSVQSSHIIKPTLTVNQFGETVSLAITTVPIIFGLETSYRTVTLTSTLSKTPTTVSHTNSSDISPTVTSAIVTYFTTTTHTVPFTVDGHTIYTTVEETNSRVTTETLDTSHDAAHARANRFTKISGGVTLIVASNVDNSLNTPQTLQPTLVTGAAVHMRDGITGETQLSASSSLLSSVLSSMPLSLSTLFDTRTLYTTFTYFTTFYTDDTSIISSSEQTLSNVVTIPYTQIVASSSISSSHQTLSPSISPYVLYETSERVRTSTVYSTLTYFATLFNGSSSTITPLEEIKTELFTIREPIRITRTLKSSLISAPSTKSTQLSSLFTQTYFTTYTNLITFFHNNRPITSTIEETVTSEVIFTVPYSHSSISSDNRQITTTSSLIKPTTVIHSPLLSTRSTYTTLTHYITLFSGSQTILSSIEEISPTVVTEVSGQTSDYNNDFILPNVRVTQESHKIEKQSKDLLSALVASISTLFTTHTYYTTLFSGTTSTIISRKESTSSLVTLYIPQSLAVKPSSSASFTPPIDQTSTYLTLTDGFIKILPTLTTDEQIFTSVTEVDSDTYSRSQTEDEELIESSFNSASSGVRAIQPSLRIDSSSYDIFDSRVISKAFEDLQNSEGLTEEQLSSVVAEVGGSTTIIDGSTIVFFTNFILPTETSSKYDDILSTDLTNIAKGPAGDLVSSLLNHADISLLNDLLSTHIDKLQASSLRDTLSPVYMGPHSTQQIMGTSALKPGSVIELSDLLDGANLAGNIGEAIKDIVHILAKAPKSKNVTVGSPDRVERVGQSRDILPPREGIAVSNSQDPVYIPLGSLHKSKPKDSTLSTTNIETIITIIPESSFTQINKIKDSVQTASSNTYIRPTKSISHEHMTRESENGMTYTLYNMDSLPLEPSIETSSSVMRSQQVAETQKPTPELSSEDVFSSNLSKTAISKVSSGATTIFFTDTAEKAIFSNLHSSQQSSKSTIESTKYVTSVESTTKTLTITTTKVYYTRDSPLTITSVLTTTIPPRTFVSTIIGTKTILGTAGDSQTKTINPSQAHRDVSTTVTTTTLIFNSMTTTVVRTLVLPTATQSTKSVSTVDAKLAFQRPSRKPGHGSFRPPTRATATEAPSFKPSGTRSRPPYNARQPPTRPPFIKEAPVTPPTTTKQSTTPVTTKTTRPSILDYDLCKPACNAANKEMCKEIDGKYKCDCRQGFVRTNGDNKCYEMQNYVVIVRVMKIGESEVSWVSQLSNNKSNEYQNLAKMAKQKIDSAYMATEIKENYIGSHVSRIDKVNDGNGILVNLTVQLTKRTDLDEELLREELMKSFEHNSESLPNPQFITADVEDVIDFDECSSDQYNDCAPSALCINEPGSYRCQCMNGYPDMDPSLPGRVCASEIKACEYCNGRGDCYRDNSGQFTSCKCYRMFLGRKCEINGLLLATLLPIAAILSIISICCVVYCCRKWRKRTNISKGFRNIASFGPNVIGGTLDRKAMLETSSESSDHLRPHVYDGPNILPSDPNAMNAMNATSESSHQRRRESEPSLDRSMASVGGAFTSLPQIVIPRARHSPHQLNYTIHRGQMYMW